MQAVSCSVYLFVYFLYNLSTYKHARGERMSNTNKGNDRPEAVRPVKSVKPSRTNPNETKYKRPVKPLPVSDENFKDFDLNEAETVRMPVFREEALDQTREIDFDQEDLYQEYSEKITTNNHTDLGQRRETAVPLAPVRRDNVKVEFDEELPKDSTQRMNIAGSYNFDSKTDSVRVTYRDEKRQADQDSDDEIIRNAARITILESASKPIPWYNRLQRRGPSKEYRLKGFANKEYAKRTRRRKLTYQRWANIIFWVIIVILFLAVYYWLDPVDDINQLMRMLGID